MTIISNLNVCRDGAAERLMSSRNDGGAEKALLTFFLSPFWQVMEGLSTSVVLALLGLRFCVVLDDLHCPSIKEVLS